MFISFHVSYIGPPLIETMKVARDSIKPLFWTCTLDYWFLIIGTGPKKKGHSGFAGARTKKEKLVLDTWTNEDRWMIMDD